MSLRLLVRGELQSDKLKAGSFQATSSLNQRDTASMVLCAPTSANWYPNDGDPIIVQETPSPTSRKLFAGSIDRVTEISPRGATEEMLFWQVDCVDYHQLADRYRVAAVYENASLAGVVNAITETYLAADGITLDRSSETSLAGFIPRVVFNYTTVTDALNRLAEAFGFAWYIDYDKVLYFVSRETNLAPFGLTTTSQNYLANTMRITRTREQYRNRQYVRAGQETTSVRTELFKGRGQDKTFNVAFPVAIKPTVKVNGTAQTVGIAGLDTGRQWYWNKGATEISQDDAGTPLTSSDTLTVEYQGFFPVIVVASDEEQIIDRAVREGGSGVYESLTEEPNIDTGDEALARADALLRRFGEIPVIVEFDTDTPGLREGQLLEINVPRHRLDGKFFIETVSVRERGDLNVRYAVKALSGERVGGWVEFFRDMSNRGGQLIVRDNEVLLLLRRVPEQVIFGDDINVQANGVTTALFGTALFDYSEFA